jgi:CPA1 family monovalent cation:H+ antiporter
MDLHILGPMILLLLIACVVAIGVERIKLPYTIALVLVGLAICLFKFAPHVTISHDVIFEIVLPLLLFYSAMHMNLDDLWENRSVISLLSVLGVISSTLLIGGLMHLFMGFEFMPALLFGALITPTDPISVIAILKKVNCPKRLRMILEGESLFNDGTSAVVFLIVLAMILDKTPFNLGSTFISFVQITGGGTVIGGVLGYITYRILKTLDQPRLEAALTVVLALGASFLAEMLHCSGIIAAVVAGLIMGNYGRIFSMSEKTRETLDHFWGVLEFIINSLLFLVIGMELQEVGTHDLMQLWKPIVGAIIVLVFSRAVVVYPIVWLRNKMADNNIPHWWAHILCWGGLKGSISIALVVGLPKSLPYRHDFLVITFAVVLFTLIIQGLTIQPLVKAVKTSD